MPVEIYNEVTVKNKENPALSNWAKANRLKLKYQQDYKQHIRHVLENGYGRNLTSIEIDEIGADYNLIACALNDKEGSTVVTSEVSKPKKKRGNRKIPDVFEPRGVQCIRPVGLIEVLDFTTK